MFPFYGVVNDKIETIEPIYIVDFNQAVAVGYARSSPKGIGVILEIDFAGRVAISNHYFQQGERFGEDEWLIEGVIRDVRVRPI